MVVLHGAETPQRKFVDWEIKATPDKEHGLIGINLPTNPRLLNGNVTVPNRLFDNIQSGYAIWTNWQTVAQNPALHHWPMKGRQAAAASGHALRDAPARVF